MFLPATILMLCREEVFVLGSEWHICVRRCAGRTLFCTMGIIKGSRSSESMPNCGAKWICGVQGAGSWRNVVNGGWRQLSREPFSSDKGKETPHLDHCKSKGILNWSVSSRLKRRINWRKVDGEQILYYLIIWKINYNLSHSSWWEVSGRYQHWEISKEET